MIMSSSHGPSYIHNYVAVQSNTSRTITALLPFPHLFENSGPILVDVKCWMKLLQSGN